MCCKINIGNRAHKMNECWNENVKEVVKEKRDWYIPEDEDFVKYRLTRQFCRRVIEAAKDKSWTKDDGKQFFKQLLNPVID